MSKQIWFLTDQRGATAVEYAIMIALIVVTMLVTVSVVGQRANSVFNQASTAIGSVSGS